MGQGHLSHHELARAAVEPGAGRRDHVERCPGCREELAALRADLAKLGRRARREAPRPRGAFAWPRAALPAPSPRRGVWLGAPLAGALAAALLLALAWLGPRGDAAAPLPALPGETQLLAEALKPEAEELDGFVGFLAAENRARLDRDFHSFISAGGDGAEEVTPWAGEL